ncbi:MAG TPA: site-2 protease family protein [Gemmata sp.]
MRDPMSWSIPVLRAFGIQVRVHIFFFVITLGLFFRQMSLPQYDAISWVDKLLFTVVLLFLSVLLHEFGHCFGARYVGGDAREILIWPLGGLAFTEIPNRWKALFITVAAGPAVNVLICVVCAAALLGGGFVPSLDPTNDPLTAQLSNRDGRTYTSPSRVQLYYKGGRGEPTLDEFRDKVKGYEARHGAGSFPRHTDAAKYAEAIQEMGFERTVTPAWVVWAYRVFWLNWVMFLFNLLPAYPLDGGKLLQALVWARTDHRRGIVVAAYTGFGVALVFLVVSIAWNEALFLGLALFMLFEASRALMQLESEEGPFGYDFSAGYTSLERDDEPPARPRRPGFVTRWREARRARKAAAAAEAKQRDEERMDQILEKIARSGQGSLTEEERLFLRRVSDRKRKTP